MNVSNTAIIIVFSAFITGIGIGASGTFFGMSDSGLTAEVSTSKDAAVPREYKFSNNIVSGEFDVNSESPEIQGAIEGLVRGYVEILDAVFKVLPNDMLRKHALGAFAEMMLMSTIKMAEITEELKSYEAPREDVPAAPEVPKKRGVNI